MALKRIILLPVLFFLTGLVFGQPVIVKKSDVKVTEAGQTFYLHTVEPGQTLYSIARAYEVDQAEIIKYNPSASAGLLSGQDLKIPDLSSAATPKVTEAQQRAGDAPSGREGFLTHTVMPGETLFGIARKYSVTPQEVIQANPGITDFETLHIGQEMKIPVKMMLGESMVVLAMETDTVIMHTVQKGESLYGIAQRYKISIDSLLAWNPDLMNKPLRKGQELRIVVKIKRPQLVIDVPTTQYDTILHQIQDKETIWGLARRYNTTVEQIIALNPELKDGLKKGYYIYVPVPASPVKSSTPAKKSMGCEFSRYRSKYKVALMIPLYLDEIDRIFITPGAEDQIQKPFFKSFSFVEFYEGMLIAVDSMKKAGLSIDLYVYDTGNDSNMVKKILAKPELPYMDLIIGPFFIQNYNLVARYAIQHNIKIVSPFARNPQVVAQNSNVFQMNASSESKMEELARFITKAYQEPNVIMVIGESEPDKALARVFRQSLEAHSTTLVRKPQFCEVVYTEKGMAGVSTRLDVNKPNIVVNLITGETMISGYISSMAKLTKNFDITMFGLPEWRDYRTFDLDDLMAVKLHLFANTFVDYSNPVTIEFLREFTGRYKGEPEENNYGFLGYDIGLFFLKALYEFGLDFENCLDQMMYTPLSTDFRWKQVNGKGYENVHLNIYRYNEFELEPVKMPK